MSGVTMFGSVRGVAAVVTLILIENSAGMRASWPVLSQHYLPTLLGAMRQANPVVPIPVLWLTTAPVSDDATDVHGAPPRQYNQLPELKFSFSPDNKITSRIIHRATELMLDAAARFHGAVAMHLFIVAASPPQDGTWGVPPPNPPQMASEWRLLGQRLAQLQIHCHMILPASHHMAAMHDLFASSLEHQGHAQVRPWFTAAPEYTFLLSGAPPAYARTDVPQDAPEHAAAPPAPAPALTSTRPPVHRHQSFPQDASSDAPSLVTSLQKVHGLSRKKLYGTQPPRQPFVREEPVRAKYKSTPPLSIPGGPVSAASSSSSSSSPSLSLSSGKERRRTLTHAEHGSPGRRGSWTRSTEVGSPSSPGALSPTMAEYRAPEAAYFSAPPPTAWPVSPATGMPVPDPGAAAPLPPMSKYRVDKGRVKDAGDVPFIFSPELEAATAAKLKAALQCAPVSVYADVRPEAGEVPVWDATRCITSSSSLQGWAG